MIPAALLGAGTLFAYVSTRGPKNNVSVKTRSGKSYNVQNLPDKQESAEKLFVIESKLNKLIKSYKDDPATMGDPRVQTLVERFRPENICENDIQDSSTSYSENKGEKIVVCLRDKKEPYPFVDDNTVMFVLLHEMAHLMSTTIGHTPEFWTNFRRMLQDAVAIGIYQNVNYAKSPTPYCGMTITDSPL